MDRARWRFRTASAPGDWPVAWTALFVPYAGRTFAGATLLSFEFRGHAECCDVSRGRPRLAFPPGAAANPHRPMRDPRARTSPRPANAQSISLTRQTPFRRVQSSVAAMRGGANGGRHIPARSPRTNASHRVMRSPHRSAPPRRDTVQAHSAPLDAADRLAQRVDFERQRCHSRQADDLRHR